MLRRVIVALMLLGLLALGAIMVGRAVRTPSRQMPVIPAARPSIEAGAAAARLGHALQFKTLSAQDQSQIDRQPFIALREYLVRTFGDAHRVLKREIIEELSVLYTWPGSEPTLPPLLILGHLDVVPVETSSEDDWVHPPFSGIVADGYVWGRGAMDDKVAVVGSLEAVDQLARAGFVPRRTVVLAFGHDEEVGGEQGARQIARALAARGAGPALLVDEGMGVLEGVVPGVARPVAMIGVAEKGYATYEFIVESEGGHSSMPPRPTSVGILSRALRAVDTHTMPAHFEGPVTQMFEFLTPELSFGSRLVLTNLWLFRPAVQYLLDRRPPTHALIRTTFAPTVLEGSHKENVLPPRARALVNVRIHPGDSPEDVEAFLMRTVNDERVTIRRLDGIHSTPSQPSPIEGDAFSVLHRTIGEVLPDVMVVPGLVLGATDSRHYRDLTSAIYRFMPLRLTMEDTVRIHGVNERVGIDNYREIVHFYMRLIRNVTE